MPVEEFDQARAAIEPVRDADYATFREDYEIHGAETGTVEVGYAGALAIHLLPAGGSWGIDQPTWAQIAVIKNCPNDDCVYQNMPYPNYHSVSNSNAYNGTINYNSLQIRYEKRFAAGAAITSGYTFSKSLGDSDTTMSWLDSGADGMPQDYNNIKGEHSILSYSIKNRWVSSFVLDLPVGKGKKYFNNENGIVDRVIGGWGINGITTLQSGQHLLLTDGNGDALAGSHGHGLNAGQLRPDYIADCDKLKGSGGSQQKRMNGWFNTSCFLAPDANPSNPHPGPYALGNEPRVDSNLVGSGIANWDFTAQKTTRITEKTNLEFRMEFYNLFNRRQWNLPNGDVSSPGFGTINDQQNNPRQMQASLRFNF